MTMSVPPPNYVQPADPGDGLFLNSFNQVNPMMWLSRDPSADMAVLRLSGILYGSTSHLQWYDAYLEGEQPLSYMSPTMAKELNGLLRPVVLNWCRLVVEAYVARMRVEGFRYAGSEDTDDDLWSVWQANGMDRLSRQALLEMLALGRAYIIVGAPDPDDTSGNPVVTVESPFQVTTVRDPRTRKVTQAVKLWQDLNFQRWATLYLPNQTVTYKADGLHWVAASPDGGDPVDQHNLGMVPVVPLVNRGRVLRPNGVSEFHDVIPIVDAAIKAATDMMISAEYHAMPRRWVFGLKKEDFKDQNGNPVSMWSRIAGRIWSAETKDVNVGQFPEAALNNFHETIKLLAGLASQVASLPANYLAFNAFVPPSADAMRAIDSQMELRVSGKLIDCGEAFEDVQRLILRFKNGTLDPKAQSIETVWADPGTSTTAQKADAAVKLYAAKIISREQAQEFVGYGPIVRKRMNDAIDAEATKGLLALQDQFSTQAQAQLPEGAPPDDPTVG